MGTPRTATRTLFAATALAVVASTIAVGGGGTARAAPNFDAGPTTLSFASTYVGASASIDVVVTNVSSVEQPTISMAGGAAGDPNFGGSQNCQGQTLAPGGTCEVTYTFQPQAEGPASASTNFTINGESFSVSMSGTGLYPFSVAPTDLSFPDTAVGETSSIPVVVTNISGVEQAAISMAGGAAGDPNFSGSQNCQGQTLAAGATCEVTYTFQPLSAGALSASTNFSINGKSFAITMSGTGVDPAGTTTTTTTTTTTATTTTPPTSTSPTATSTAATTTAATVPATVAPPVTGATTSSPVALSPIPAPITHGDAYVIAQGIVAFADGAFAWDHDHLDPAGWPYQLDDSPSALIVADGPDGLLVSDESGPLALLDSGEAAFVPAGTSGDVRPLFDGAFAEAQRITFVAAEGAGAFAPGSGLRDVNLIGGILGPDESLGVRSPFPVLVVVTEGQVVDSAGTVIDTDVGPVVLSAEVELTNSGAGPANVLIAAVGGAAG